MKYFLLVFLFLQIICLADITGQQLNDRIYASYISANMQEWALVIEEMKDVWELTGSIETLYDLSFAQYGYIGFCIYENKKKRAREVLKETEENVKLLLEHDDKWAQVYALSGALNGLKVGIDLYKVFIYGRQAFIRNAIAMKYGPLEPQVWMEKGNLEMYKPSVLGNDLSIAINAYEKSIRLYEKDSRITVKNWLYLNTLVSLADAYRKEGLYIKADAVYKKILRIEPNIIWIRDKDYPQFREKYMRS